MLEKNAVLYDYAKHNQCVDTEIYYISLVGLHF